MPSAASDWARTVADPTRTSRLDIPNQLLQRRPLQTAAGESTIIIAIGDRHPASGLLAGDIGLAGLTLRIETIEFLVEAFLGRLARISRAAQFADRRVDHCVARWLLRP